MPQPSMIGVERIARILKIITVTSMSTSPISCVLIAASDSGKTQLLFKNIPPDARILNDFTYMNLVSIFSEKNPPKWIILPDLNAVIAHRPTVAQLTMACLLSLLGEGMTEIPGVDGKAKLKIEEMKKSGVHCGLITAVTPETFRAKRGKWRETGLLRRLIPIYYKYSPETISEISASIRNGNDHLDYSPKMTNAIKEKNVSMSPSMASAVDSLASTVVSSQLVWNGERRDGTPYLIKATELPFTLHKVFRTFVKASAMLQNRTRINEYDIEMLQRFSKFIRYDRPEEI